MLLNPPHSKMLNASSVSSTLDCSPQRLGNIFKTLTSRSIAHSLASYLFIYEQVCVIVFESIQAAIYIIYVITSNCTDYLLRYID